MDFKALREYSREQILGVFGVPPFLAGVHDKANYANAREQKEVYWQGTIKRFLTGVQWTINADFLPKVGVTGVEVYPDWESVNALTENLNEKADVAAKFLALGFTKRQINDRLRLGFDVDELEDAWRAAIGAKPRPASAKPTAQVTPTYVPTYVPISGVPLAVTPTPYVIPTSCLSPDRPLPFSVATCCRRQHPVLL